MCSYLLLLQTSQTLAQIQPCSSYALCLLGNAQLASFDLQPSSSGAKDLLSDSRKSFLASILMEGRPNSGEPLSQVTGFCSCLFWAVVGVFGSQEYCLDGGRME